MANAVRSNNASKIVWGFIAGALAVAVFHQLTVLLLNNFVVLWRLAPVSPDVPGSFLGSGIWRVTPSVPPFGVPPILNQMFWGGLWGIVFAWISASLPRGMGYLMAGFLFGAIILVLSSWFLVPFIKSLFGVGNLRYGPNSGGWWRGPVINGMWGLGTATFLMLFGRR
jgi:hypothetical protein